MPLPRDGQRHFCLASQAVATTMSILREEIVIEPELDE